ncbi:MAG: Usg family protein [Alphaproteobacteria bacterium]|nr:Usg family protein [Alphaproteobacteria bacterium]MBV9552887.1 Usg family protein [Alphaproteobacteria bacterium]
MPASQYRLTTAEIIYRLPDHPSLLQTYIWQKFDRAPEFPELSRFLKFWRDNLDGELHSVRVGQGPARREPLRHILPGSATRH